MRAQLDLPKSELEIVLGILGEFLDPNVVEVFAFGSRVTGKAKPTSDLDLVLSSASPIEFSTIGRVRELMQESDLHVRVDVSDMARLDPEFRKVVEAEAIHLWP